MKKTLLLLFLSVLSLVACKGGDNSNNDETKQGQLVQSFDAKAHVDDLFEKAWEQRKRIRVSQNIRHPEIGTIGRCDVFHVWVNHDNQILTQWCGSKPIEARNKRALTNKIKDFINPEHGNNDYSWTNFKEENIDLLGEIRVLQCYIELRIDTQKGSHNVPPNIQTAIVDAFLQIRDEQSIKHFGKHYDDISKEQRIAIDNYTPIRLMEKESVPQPPESEVVEMDDSIFFDE